MYKLAIAYKIEAKKEPGRPALVIYTKGGTAWLPLPKLYEQLLQPYTEI